MNYWNIRKSKIFSSKKNIVVAILFFATNLIFAQYNTFSPYSRYGIGDIQENTMAHQKAMSNSGIALPLDTTAPVFINILNPASLSSLRLTTIEGSGNYFNTHVINNQNYKVNQKSFNFNSLVIGFPIKSHSGFCFGLLPHSFVGYQITQNTWVNNIGNVNYVYDGSGGLNKVFASYGFSITKYFNKYDSSRSSVKELIKNLSFGINCYYLFGELAQTATVNYPSNTTYYNFVNDRRLRISGISSDIGLQTHILLNERKKSTLNFGLIFSYPSQLKVINDYIAYNFSYTFLNEKYIVDTLQYAEDENGKMKLPPHIGFGISYIVNNEWGISTDIKYTNWEKFHLLNERTNLKNNIEINAGAYYQPDRFATGKGKYFDRVIYRAGVGYNSGYQEYQGKSIALYSFSAGMSFPMGLYRTFSALHLSVQYAIKGNRNNIIRENIIRITIGATLNDKWFIKYKYD